MLELNRRHLLLGGTASLAGAAAVPLLQAPPAFADDPKWREVVFKGVPGGDTLTTFAGPFGILAATYTGSGNNIVAQARMDVPSSGPKYWTNIPHRGRVTQSFPVNPQIGIFGQANGGERYRISVAGFGIVVLNGAQPRIRFQVMGSNGQRYWGEYQRYNNEGTIQAAINTFVDQTNTLNLQYQNFWNSARQYGLGFGPAVTAGITGLIVTGANPLTIVGLISAAIAGGIALIGNLVTAQNTYLTTMNQMIESFERIATAIGLPAPDIARYNVGGVRYNQAQIRYTAQPTFTPINVPNP